MALGLPRPGFRVSSEHLFRLLGAVPPALVVSSTRVSLSPVSHDACSYMHCGFFPEDACGLLREVSQGPRG